MTDLGRLHEESGALIETFADRLPPERVAQLRTWSDAGEWLELVEGLCASLVKRRIPVTPGEYDAVASVLSMFDNPQAYYPYTSGAAATLGALNVDPT